MTQPRPFTLEFGTSSILDRLGLNPADLLRQARLPEDLFSRPRPTLSPKEYFRMWEVLRESINDENMALMLGQAIQVEAFSPPLFAAFCSPDYLTALHRLSQYKPLIGPMKLVVQKRPMGLEVVCEVEDCVAPPDFHHTELVVLVQMARLGTRQRIVPLSVEMTDPPTSGAFADFFGVEPMKSDTCRLLFAMEDVTRPFVAANPGLFQMFEPDLRKRLGELAAGSSFADRVRTALMEALPSGQADARAVAKRLGVSSRSLQRRLAQDGTSFKGELQSLRTRLAERYLAEPRYSLGEIAFLLGYEDPNSFFRAFRSWTGTTPEAMRRILVE